jgi:hypothetical protein
VIKKFFQSSPLLPRSKSALPTSKGEGRIKGLRLLENRLHIPINITKPVKLIDFLSKLFVKFPIR